jgi:hypothetical protein
MATIQSFDSGKFVVDPVIRTSDFTAQAGRLHLVDTNLGPVTVTAPTVSRDQGFAIADYGNFASDNNIRIATTTSKYYGAADDLLVDVNRGVVVLKYVDSTIGWIRGSDTKTDAAAVTTLVGATASLNGSSGSAPSPLSGQQNHFLSGSGTWKLIEDPLLYSRR